MYTNTSFTNPFEVNATVLMMGYPALKAMPGDDEDEDMDDDMNDDFEEDLRVDDDFEGDDIDMDDDLDLDDDLGFDDDEDDEFSNENDDDEY